jgi:hypothetical protein
MSTKAQKGVCSPLRQNRCKSAPAHPKGHAVAFVSILSCGAEGVLYWTQMPAKHQSAACEHLRFCASTRVIIGDSRGIGISSYERCGRSEPCERRQRDDAKQQARSDWSQGGSIACLPRAKPWPPEAKQLDSL